MLNVKMYFIRINRYQNPSLSLSSLSPFSSPSPHHHHRITFITTHSSSYHCHITIITTSHSSPHIHHHIITTSPHHTPGGVPPPGECPPPPPADHRADGALRRLRARLAPRGAPRGQKTPKPQWTRCGLWG